MPEADLPEGVVTFVFTDIEGSTRLLQETTGVFSELLEVHRGVLRRAFAAFDGREVNTEGDGCFFAFASARSAVLAAAEAQRNLAAEPRLSRHGVKVRIGMHTGEAERTGHDYVGLAVHHAARVANAGHGGQALVSEATRLMAGEAEGIRFTDLGSHVLKDLAMPVQIFQLTGPGLAGEFPPLRSLNGTSTQLPISRTSFVGRERDLNQLLDDLLEPGLITLTGPGGSGKTRLAVEAAREVRGSLEGAWFVDLLSANDADQVISVTAAALGVADVGQANGSINRMIERVGVRPCLVILDNCEHVVKHAAELADRLLSGCPSLRVLATSRDLLGLAHERARRVPPLELANAVELFVDRAARTVPGFEPINDVRLVIERICGRLDGIPLAIELAAPRLRHIALADLESRLDDVLRLLGGSRSRGTDRHQTLQAVVDWSYNLLSTEEQAVLRRLSVLSGGFRMEAAAAIADEPTTTAFEDTVFRLVDHSLVDHDGHGRYRQLETLRAYGRAKLQESGELDKVRSRHLAYFADWAEGVGPGLKDNRFFDSLDQLEAESENLHSALEWAADQKDHPAALRLIAATVHFGTLTSRASLVKLADRALEEASSNGPPNLVAAAFVEFGLAATTLGWTQYAGHATQAMTLLGTETTSPHKDDPLRAWALASLALLNVRAEPPDLEGTRGYVDRAEALASRCDIPAVTIAARSAMAWDLMRTGDIDGARQDLALLVESAEPLNRSLWFTLAVFWSGIASMRAGDWSTARDYYEEALALFRRMSYKLYSQWALDHLSTAAVQMKDYSAARAYAEEGVAVSLAGGLGADSNLAYLYERLGYLEWRRADHSQSAHYYQEALALMSVDKDAHDHAALRSNLAVALVACGEIGQAREHLVVALDVVEGLVSVQLPTGAMADPPVANLAQGVAHLAFALDLPDEATELAGLALKLHPAPPMTPESPGARFHDRLKAALGDDRYTAAVERGAALDKPLSRIREVLGKAILPA